MVGPGKKTGVEVYRTVEEFERFNSGLEDSYYDLADEITTEGGVLVLGILDRCFHTSDCIRENPELTTCETMALARKLQGMKSVFPTGTDLRTFGSVETYSRAHPEATKDDLKIAREYLLKHDEIREGIAVLKNPKQLERFFENNYEFKPNRLDRNLLMRQGSVIQFLGGIPNSRYVKNLKFLKKFVKSCNKAYEQSKRSSVFVG